MPLALYQPDIPQVRGPRDVPGEVDAIEVIEHGAAETAVMEHEPAGLYDIRGNLKAGSEAQNRSRVLGYVGLVKGEAHRSISSPAG